MMDIEKARDYLEDCKYPAYTFHAIVDGRGEMYLQAAYMEPDIDKPEGSPPEIQLTRRWFISPEMSKSELVQTAFKCIMTSMEHRVREHFKYRGELIFGPHFDVDGLYQLASQRQLASRESV